MSKQDRVYQGRLEGLELAVKICEAAEKDGRDPIKALREEIRFRTNTKVNLLLTREEFDKANTPMRETTIKTIGAASMIVLWDYFGFGKDRLLRFQNAFMDYTRSLCTEASTWCDITETLRDKFGIVIDLSDENILGKGDYESGGI